MIVDVTYEVVIRFYFIDILSWIAVACLYLVEGTFLSRALRNTDLTWGQDDH